MGFSTIRWAGGIDGAVELVEQTRLPAELVYVRCSTADEVRDAIRTMRIRGAPAIGVAAAMGLVLGVRDADEAAFPEAFARAKELLASARPTGANLFWALDRMERTARDNASLPLQDLKQHLLDEALAIADEDHDLCQRIGMHGAALLKDGDTVLTHCNAGALATAGWGTALGIVFAAAEQGKRVAAYVDETRPLLQGTRLTAWELQQAGIPVTLICDSAAAQVMRERRVNAVLVGADRIAANGDTANKVGTYGLSILARAHRVPFYVAAPSSTFDLSISDGDHIPIEQRAPEEVTRWGGRVIAPEGVGVYNPAFDVTPARNITAIVTEHGVIRRPTAAKIAAHFRRAQ